MSDEERSASDPELRPRSEAGSGPDRESGPESSSGLFPISEHRIEQGFYLVLLVWVGLLMFFSLDLDFSSRLMPMLVGIPMLALIVLQLVPVDWNQLLDRLLPVSPASETEDAEVELAARTDDDRGHGPAEEQKTAVEMISWCLVLMVLVYLFGYYFTLPPYVFAFTWYFKRDLRAAAIVTVVFTVIVTLLFVVLFEQLLYTGIFDLPNPTFWF